MKRKLEENLRTLSLISFSLLSLISFAYASPTGGVSGGSVNVCGAGDSQLLDDLIGGPNSYATGGADGGGDIVSNTNCSTNTGGNNAPVINVNHDLDGTPNENNDINVVVASGTQLTSALVMRGVTATDTQDGNITPSIIHNPQTYPVLTSGQSVTYSFDVIDSGGLAAVTKTKTFSVAANQAPTISVDHNQNGNPNQASDLLINVNAGTQITLSDVLRGVTANDAEDGVIPVNASNVTGPALPLTTSSGAVYNFTFNVSDSQGANAQPRTKSFQTEVVNNAPVLTINPSQVSALPGTVLNAAFILGLGAASATDVEDGNIAINASHIISGPLGTTAVAGQNYNFTFRVSDSGGLPSNTAVLTVRGETNQIILQSPANNQVGTSTQPTLRWTTLYPVDPNTTFTWKISSNAQCASSTSDLTGSVQGFEYRPSDYQLNNSTSYYWCVKSDQLGIGYTNPSHFTTQQVSIPIATIFPLPSTSAASPSGQRDILIFGTNGEVGSRAYVYQVVNSNLVELGSVVMNDQGDFVLPFTASASTPTEYEFVARIKRGNAFGDYSEATSYYFDPALTVPRPELKHLVPQQTGKMRWVPVTGATSYDIWRRVGHELCELGAGSCYQTNKPYERIATLQSAGASIVDGHIIFEDSAYRTTAPLGTSYFVTAKNSLGQSSVRSNSISFQDTSISDFHPDYHSIARADGYNIDVFLCDSSLAYAWDNSADMRVLVQYAERDIGESCEDFDFDNQAASVETLFDSLARNSYPTYGLNGCALANTHEGLPGRSYCERICIEDISGNRKECSDGSDINTPVDNTAPGFPGITNVIPQEDGFSAKVMWGRAQASASLETIQYEVKYTKNFDSAGLPIFSNNTVIVDNIDQTEATIAELETGVRYAFEVNALDTSGNRAGIDNFLRRSTLDNRPQIIALGFDQVPNPHRPEQKRLSLQIVDREATFGDQVALKKVEYQLAGQGWKDFDLATDLIVNQAQMNSLFAASTPGESNETDFILDARNHFIKMSNGKIRVTIEDSHGLESQKEVDVALLQGASDYANYSAGGDASFGCSSTAKESNPWAGFLNFVAILLLIFLPRMFRTRKI